MLGFGAGSIEPSTGSSGPKLDSGVAFVVALILFGSAIFTMASPNMGASHFGSHAPAYARAGAMGSDAPEGRPGASSGAAVSVEAVVAIAWLVDLSHVVMSVAMGFMLLLMT